MSVTIQSLVRNKRMRKSVLIAFALYFIISFLNDFRLPSTAVKTEFSSSKLKLDAELEKNANWKKSGLNFQSNSRSSLPIESTLRQQLSYQFPYEEKKDIPKTIWQTWKVGLEHAEFPESYQKLQETWTRQNPGYTHFVIPDEAAHELIKSLYETVPDVWNAYNFLPKSILKADFFRYLILFARGGTYTDIDTMSIRPISSWVSNNETIYDKPNTAGLVIGIEADPDRPDWNDWYARRIQFCQWTIQSKKGHPMLRELIAKITELTLQRQQHGQLKKTLGKDEGGDIMNWTGPGIWTDYIFKYMNNVFDDAKTIDWKFFTGMENPIVVDDVLVLPITSFSPGVGQMGAHSEKHPSAYAKHMFSGSWKHDEITKENDE